MTRRGIWWLIVYCVLALTMAAVGFGLVFTPLWLLALSRGWAIDDANLTKMMIVAGLVGALPGVYLAQRLMRPVCSRYWRIPGVKFMLDPWPHTRPETWAAISGFITNWHRPLAASDRTSPAALSAAAARLGITIPEAVREFYELAGNAQDVWSIQDWLLAPDEWRFEDDVLIVCVENQAVVHWGVRRSDLDKPDPAVLVSDLDDPSRWLEVSESFAQWALQLLLMQTTMGLPRTFWANAYPTDEAISLVQENFRRCPFPDSSWPRFPTRFYIATDTIVGIAGEGTPDTWLWLTCRNEHLFRSLKEELSRTGMKWEAASDDP